MVPGVQLAAQKHQGVFAATTGERNDPKSRLAIPIFSAKSREVSQMFCCFRYNFGQFADLRCFSGISDFPQFRQISMKNNEKYCENVGKKIDHRERNRKNYRSPRSPRAYHSPNLITLGRARAFAGKDPTATSTCDARYLSTNAKALHSTTANDC